MFSFFDLPHIDPASLVGYQEDKLALKRFEWRFRPVSLVGVLLIFGAPIGDMMGKISAKNQIFTK